MVFYLLQGVSGIKKIDHQISSYDIKIERVKKNAKMAALIVDTLVDIINEALLDAVLFEEDKKIESTSLMESYDNNTARVDTEGEILVLGDKDTIKRRVGCSQVNVVVISVNHVNLKGTMKYDMTPTHGAKHCNVSEFNLVKSANTSNTRAEQNIIDIDNPNETKNRKEVQDKRLDNLSRLERRCRSAKQYLLNTQNSVKICKKNWHHLVL